MRTRRHLSAAATVVVAALAAPLAGISGAGAAPASPPGWSLQAAASPTYPSGELFATSCPTPSWCMAVGLFQGSTGAQQPMSESWNGTRWTLQPLANPATAPGWLAGVSCVSPSSCVAVGAGSGAGSLAEAWNGKAWSEMATAALPRGESALDSVSCASSSACTAVGWYSIGTMGYTAPAAESWNGKTWTRDALAQPPGPSAGLTGISCVSALWCEAVGNGVDPKTFQGVTLAEHWNGATWSRQSSPDQPGGTQGSYFEGVSCPSTTTCLAAGSYEEVSSSGGIAYHAYSALWSGAAWSQAPAAPGDQFFGVSCATASVCEAAGSSTVDSWNGKAWTADRSSKAGFFDGVSCAPARLTPAPCTAVGNYFYVDGNDITLAERWNGSSWALQSASNEWDIGDAGPMAVSCSSASACAAAGQFSLQTPGCVAESWNGKAWAVEPAQGPANAFNSTLAGVACPGGGSCAAAGTWWPAVNGASSRALVLAEKAGKWTIEPIPVEGALEGISCPTAIDCVAVGASATATTDDAAAMALSWNGTKWAQMSVPQPSWQGAEMSAVSCASTSSCVAVEAGPVYTSGGGKDIAWAWNGTRWSLLSMPAPSAAANVSFSGISCASATSCVAVGQYELDSGEPESLVETWGGKSWTIAAQPASLPAASSLAAVSCASATACAAVGTYQDAKGVSQPLAESCDGTAWVLDAVPAPAGVTGGAELQDVSCVASGWCDAIGTYDTAAADGLVFAETVTLP